MPPARRGPAVTLYRRKPSSCRLLTYRHRHIAPPCSAPRREGGSEGGRRSGREVAPRPRPSGWDLPPFSRRCRAPAGRSRPGAARVRGAGGSPAAAPRAPFACPRPCDRAFPRGAGALLRPRCQAAIGVLHELSVSARRSALAEQQPPVRTASRQHGKAAPWGPKASSGGRPIKDAVVWYGRGGAWADSIQNTAVQATCFRNR